MEPIYKVMRDASFRWYVMFRGSDDVWRPLDECDSEDHATRLCAAMNQDVSGPS